MQKIKAIETNRLHDDSFSQKYEKRYFQSFSSNDVPFYLRGYKAIDKEILVIQSRTENQRLLYSYNYVGIKNKILSIEKDLASSQLRNAAYMIANDNSNDWVEFDLSIAESKSIKKLKLYVALSTVLGGMVGVVYVLISNTIRKRKEQLAKA